MGKDLEQEKSGRNRKKFFENLYKSNRRRDSDGGIGRLVHSRTGMAGKSIGSVEIWIAMEAAFAKHREGYLQLYKSTDKDYGTGYFHLYSGILFDWSSSFLIIWGIDRFVGCLSCSWNRDFSDSGGNHIDNKGKYRYGGRMYCALFYSKWNSAVSGTEADRKENRSFSSCGSAFLLSGSICVWLERGFVWPFICTFDLWNFQGMAVMIS